MVQFLAVITIFILCAIIVRIPNNIKTSSKDYIETVGIIQGYKKELISKRGLVFSMIIRYTINDNSFELVEDSGKNIPLKPVGGKVKIKYHRKDILDVYIVYDLRIYYILLLISSFLMFYLMFNK